MAARKPRKPAKKAAASGKPKPTRSPNSTLDVLADIRQAEALKLRTKGLSFREIAEALEVTPSTAHSYVSKALAELAQHSRTETAQLRALELARLDVLLAKVWPLATGDLAPLIQQLRAKREELEELDPKAAKKGVLAEMLADFIDGVPSAEYVKRAESLIRARARLLGLEAPVKVANTNPDGSEERPPGAYVLALPPTMDLAAWQAAAAKAAQPTE